MARIADLAGVLLAITGKIELVYEGEQEGPAKVAHILIGKAIKSLLPEWPPDQEKSRKNKRQNPYSGIIDWFSQGHSLSLSQELRETKYASKHKSRSEERDGGKTGVRQCRSRRSADPSK